MTDIDDFFSTKMGSIPKPPILPKGTWLGTITKHDIVEVKGQDGAAEKALQLTVKLKQAEADVEPELLEQYGDLAKAFAYPQFRLNAIGKRTFDQLLVSIFGANAEGANIGDYVNLLTGKNVVCEIVHSQGKTANEEGDFPTFVNCRKVKGLPD